MESITLFISLYANSILYVKYHSTWPPPYIQWQTNFGDSTHCKSTTINIYISFLARFLFTHSCISRAIEKVFIQVNDLHFHSFNSKTNAVNSFSKSLDRLSCKLRLRCSRKESVSEVGKEGSHVTHQDQNQQEIC